MLRTALCNQLGIEHPIFSVGMGPAAGVELVAAVCNAGACGVLGGSMLPPTYLREQIKSVRKRTAKPFGVNIILSLLRGGEIEACLEERIPVLVLFWGDAAPYINDAHRRGTKVVLQVGSVVEAVAAARAGVDAVIAQGIEAGGHVKSTTSLSTLLPSVVDAVHPVPVIAAGGIGNGRSIVAALGLGAHAVSMGTRFLASEEARVPREYKDRVVQSKAEDTVYTSLFDIGWPDAPHRVLKNRTLAEWEAAGRPPAGQRPGEGTYIGTVPNIVKPGAIVNVRKYSGLIVIDGFSGDMESAALFAGESCGLVNDIRPAAQIVRDLMAEADAVLAQLHVTS
jgi:nitronate monooxygenase/enoyl-[acyl-carrier protein] reductase II